jgi:hypothetical protein
MASLDYYRNEGIKARKRGEKKSDCDFDNLTYDEADWWKAGWDQENERQQLKQIHLLRCETCDFATKLTLDASNIVCTNENHDPYPNVYACSKQNGKWMPSTRDGNPIAIVGCASHSDVDKLIKKMEESKKHSYKISSETSFIDNKNFWDGHGTGLKEAIEMIRKLRGK